MEWLQVFFICGASLGSCYLMCKESKKNRDKVRKELDQAKKEFEDGKLELLEKILEDRKNNEKGR